MTDSLWEFLLKKQSEIAPLDMSVVQEQARELQLFINSARIAGMCPIQFSAFFNKLYKSRYIERYRAMEHKNYSLNWTALSDLISTEEGVNYLRIVGPRWNCFALIGSLGPIAVENNIALKTDSLSAQSDSWSIIIYSESLKTVGCFSSVDYDSGEEIMLPPGKYIVNVRFYSDSDTLYCPGVMIDGNTLISECSFPGERKRYQRLLSAIASDQQPIYFWQQYYIFHWLSNPSSYDYESVRNEFLPVGDPNNYFDFGALFSGQSLTLSISPETVDSFRIYLVYFNEMSLPVFWGQVSDLSWCGGAVEKDGAYLIRFVPRGFNVKPNQKPEYKFNVVQAS